MALFIVCQTRPQDRRSDGQHTFIVDAANSDAARLAVGVPATWAVHQIAAAGVLPTDPLTGTAVTALAVEGRTLLPGMLTRGGDPVKAFH